MSPGISCIGPAIAFSVLTLNFVSFLILFSEFRSPHIGILPSVVIY